MIRFIDLRGQITDVEECPVEFAFFNTVTDRFLSSSFADDHVVRCIRLMPEWVL